MIFCPTPAEGEFITVFKFYSYLFLGEPRIFSHKFHSYHKRVEYLIPLINLSRVRLNTNCNSRDISSTLTIFLKVIGR